ncbi:MAG: hypothetical protein K5641_02580 [Lachnospiraceae bacterium]|nr:hypothetical protein [Lachnospiraceae bacterium]
MLNEERIKLMTRMVSYEEKEGKKNIVIGNYFRGDYIGSQVLKAVISATIVFFSICGCYIFYDFELVMKDIYQIDLVATGRKIIAVYVLFTGIYAAIAYSIASIRYSRAKKSLKRYYADLDYLSAMYAEEF